MPTLAELAARSKAGPPPLPHANVTVTLVEGQHLLDESKRLMEERFAVLSAAGTSSVDEDGERAGPPRKAGQKAVPPRVAEIDARQVEIQAELARFQNQLGLRGIPGGEWHRWKDEHPARKDSDLDDQLTGGRCNAADLFDDLGRFVATWEGEPVPVGAWDEWLAEMICYADRRDLVTEVVLMHEQAAPRLPKSSTDSSGTESSATA